MKKEAQIKVKEETYKLKEDAEREIKISKNEIQFMIKSAEKSYMK